MIKKENGLWIRRLQIRVLPENHAALLATKILYSAPLSALFGTSRAKRKCLGCVIDERQRVTSNSRPFSNTRLLQIIRRSAMRGGRCSTFEKNPAIQKLKGGGVSLLLVVQRTAAFIF
jgi:hypothetical protein